MFICKQCDISYETRPVAVSHLKEHVFVAPADSTAQMVGADGQAVSMQVGAVDDTTGYETYTGDMEALGTSDDLNLSVDADTSRIAAEVLQEAIESGTLQLLQDNHGQPGVFVTTSHDVVGVTSAGGVAQYSSAVVQGIEGLVELAQGSAPNTIALASGSDERYDFSDAAAMIMTAASADAVGTPVVVGQAPVSVNNPVTGEYSVADVMKHAVSLAGITSTDALDSSQLHSSLDMESAVIDKV